MDFGDDQQRRAPAAATQLAKPLLDIRPVFEDGGVELIAVKGVDHGVVARKGDYELFVERVDRNRVEERVALFRSRQQRDVA